MSGRILFSSASDNYWTPKDFFQRVDEIYGPFDLDVAASADNTKCEKFFTKEDDGLSKDWYGNVWCNPPYGLGIRDWMKKAWNEIEADNAKLVCFLVPARTDTKWFHEIAMEHANEIVFIKGRIRFENSPYGSTFPSMLVLFQKLKPFWEDSPLFGVMDR